jgi:hypothetical protein
VSRGEREAGAGRQRMRPAPLLVVPEQASRQAGRREAGTAQQDKTPAACWLARADVTHARGAPLPAGVCMAC